MDIWLVEVPDYADLFTIIVLIAALVRSLHEPMNILYMTLAKIKRCMIVETIVMLSTLMLIYYLLSVHYPLWSAFVILTAMEFVIILSLGINAKFEFDFTIRTYIQTVLIPLFFAGAFCLFVSWLTSLFICPSSLFSTFASSFLSFLISILVVILFMNNREKRLIISFLISKIR